MVHQLPEHPESEPVPLAIQRRRLAKLRLHRRSLALDQVDTEDLAIPDTQGFEEFYTATVGRLLGQLFPVTGDLHEAEEVVQEAFARASTRWSRIRDDDVPEAWVRRVAMNLAADRHRRQVAAGTLPSSIGRRSCSTTWPTCRSRRWRPRPSVPGSA